MLFERSPIQGMGGGSGGERAVPVSDGARSDSSDELDSVIEVHGAVSVLAAKRYERIAAFHRRAVAEARRSRGVRGWSINVVERGIRLELAAALRVTERAAERMLSMAYALVERYPAALASLSGARMTERHAEVLVDGMVGVEADVVDGLMPRAIELAETLPVGSFRRALRTLVDEARADTLAERHKTALERRRIVVEPAEDGMAWLMAFLPAVEAQAIHDRLTRIAKEITAAQDAGGGERTDAGADGAGRDAADVRTMDQVRVDAYADLLIDGDSGSVPARARGIRAIVSVVVPAVSLLTGDSASGSAVMEGVGPIPIERARELCGSSSGWMRVLTDPETGMVISVGRKRYRPPPDLRRLVRWRAEMCMAPGCTIPAGRCEIDHTVAWEHGGTTDLDNLATLCKGHHTVKHHTDWNVEQIPESGGALRWTSPSGRSYDVQPARRVPVFR